MEENIARIHSCKLRVYYYKFNNNMYIILDGVSVLLEILDTEVRKMMFYQWLLTASPIVFAFSLFKNLPEKNSTICIVNFSQGLVTYAQFSKHSTFNLVLFVIKKFAEEE